MTASPPDRRRVPFRPDLAAEFLRGVVEADRYAAGEPLQVGVTSAAMRFAPNAQAGIESEALFGERVTVYDRTPDGWTWGQLVTDDYVGWFEPDTLEPPGPAPTHRVQAVRTFVYPEPELKRPPVRALSMHSRLAVIDTAKGRDLDYALLAGGGAVVARHLGPLETVRQGELVAAAMRFLHVPYLWGGRTSLGLDCSTLVQLACASIGVAAPRDSDMQAAELGAAVPVPRAWDELAAGDLVFWPGHVGIADGAGGLVHASGHHMMVVCEPLVPAVERMAAAGTRVSGVRRLD